MYTHTHAHAHALYTHTYTHYAHSVVLAYMRQAGIYEIRHTQDNNNYD